MHVKLSVFLGWAAVLAPVCAVSAGTLALYPFDDGAAGTEVSTVASAAGTWTGGGSAAVINGGNKPAFDADAPGKYVFSGVFPTNCVLRNPQSVLFSKPSGVSSANAGGKIELASLASALTQRDTFTLEFFFKVETEATWHAAFWMPVNGAQSHRWKFSAPSGGKNAVALQNQGGSGQVAKTVTQLKDTWYHFAMTYRRDDAGTTGQVTLYLNHESAGSFTSTTEGATSGLPLTLGCSDGNSEAFWGKIAALRISEEVLSASDMLYASDRNYLELDTLAFWPFKDGSAGVAVGTVTNAVAGNPLYGTSHAGDAGLPRYSAEAPGRYVWSDAAQTKLLVRNPQSIAFHADSANGNTASSVDFWGLTSQLTVCSNFTFELFAKVETNATWRTLYYFNLGTSWDTTWKTCAPAGNANRIEFERQKPNGTAYRDLADLDDGTWHHLASVYRADEYMMRFYLDGVEVGSGLACTNCPRAGQSFILGCSNPYAEGFCGKVSCLRVTPRALQPAEFMSCSKVSGYMLIVR